ncbi:MAG: class I SAM-dependent DNA methyltransferase [Proteobacteria bacterium]|nr:class I SAM-dependent DNA methyltransferase [Pseudomonadota bacterium]
MGVTQAIVDDLVFVFRLLTDRGVEPGEAQQFVLRRLAAFIVGPMGVLQPESASTRAIELSQRESELLAKVAQADWSQVQPAIFGVLMQSSMTRAERHASGAHYTSEEDILKILRPTLVSPWLERIDGARTGRELVELHRELVRFRVLDPACGSGNFLVIAYGELKRLEDELLRRVSSCDPSLCQAARGAGAVGLRQLFGIEIQPLAAELARVTLLVMDQQLAARRAQQELPFESWHLLQDNIRCDDALFCQWPVAEAIVGNPPFQSKNKIQRELGRAYVNRLRQRRPEVGGMADFCVYWFRLAHDNLPEGGRAGLVGTNTIRQTNSRKGGLDYIVASGGAIVEAVGSQVWSGDAGVHVSIVNWAKGEAPKKRRLYRQLGHRPDSPWECLELEHIDASLSGTVDVGTAVELPQNESAKNAFQGVTPGHRALVLTLSEAESILAANGQSVDVIHPYLTPTDLKDNEQPQRHVIDFHPLNLDDARQYPELMAIVEEEVLPARRERAQAEEQRNQKARLADEKARTNSHHAGFLRHWWWPSYPRPQLKSRLALLSRYLVCPRYTKFPSVYFVNSSLRPSDDIQVFAFEDDYSFGVLQSKLHWLWFVERCSSLLNVPRYTSSTVFASFPWPANPTPEQIRAIAIRGQKLRRERLSTEAPQSLDEAQVALDEAVFQAYGLGPTEEPLAFLLEQNRLIAAGAPYFGPGLPLLVDDPSEFISADCL